MKNVKSRNQQVDYCSLGYAKEKMKEYKRYRELTKQHLDDVFYTEKEKGFINKYGLDKLISFNYMESKVQIIDAQEEGMIYQNEIITDGNIIGIERSKHDLAYEIPFITIKKVKFGKVYDVMIENQSFILVKRNIDGIISNRMTIYNSSKLDSITDDESLLKVGVHMARPKVKIIKANDATYL